MDDPNRSVHLLLLFLSLGVVFAAILVNHIDRIPKRLLQPIPVAAAVLSLLLLFLPWLTLSGDSGQALREEVKEWHSIGFTPGEIVDAIADELGGLFTDSSTLRPLASAFADGSLSAAEYTHVASSGAKLIDQSKGLLSAFLDEDDLQSMNSVRLFCLIYTPLFCLTVIFGCVSVVMCLLRKQHKALKWIFPILQTLMLIYFFCVSIASSQVMRDLFSTFDFRFQITVSALAAAVLAWITLCSVKAAVSPADRNIETTRSAN